MIAYAYESSTLLMIQLYTYSIIIFAIMWVGCTHTHVLSSTGTDPVNVRQSSQTQIPHPAPPKLKPPTDTLPTQCMEDYTEITRNRSILNTPKNRGLFWWSQRQGRYGLRRVLSSVKVRNTLISTMKRGGIKRAYIYAQPVLNKRYNRSLRSLNRALHSQGISPLFLNGSPEWSCDPRSLIKLLRDQFIPFQNNTDREGHFDGVYLDIEPHALRSNDRLCPYHWQKANNAERRALVYGMLRAIIAAHQLLNSNRKEETHSSIQVSHVPIYAYLPFWFDHVRQPNSFWESVAQRDQFYRCLSRFTDEISIASYCRDDIDELSTLTQWERENRIKPTRIALNAGHLVAANRECQTWKGSMHFLKTMRQLEFLTPNYTNVDIENLTSFLEFLDAQTSP